MAINSVLAPYPTFFDAAGIALENGYIYIGTAGFEARATPKASFFDVALTIPTGTASGAAIRTKGGFPVNQSGAPAMFYADGDYSISICDRNGVLLYSALSMTLALNVGGAVGPVLWADGSLGAVGGGFAGETNTGFVRSGAGIMQTVVQGVLVSQQTPGGTVFSQPVSGAGFSSGVLSVAQAADSDLAALANNSANGLWARTGGGTGAARTITAGAGISVSNGDGVAGNPTVSYTGIAPKAWGNINGTSPTGTYSRTGTLVTVTMTAHGLATGLGAYLDFTTGTATDGYYIVTVVDPNTFTVTDAASGATSGNVTRIVSFRGGVGLASITRPATGVFEVTLASAMPDMGYAVIPSGTAAESDAAGDVNDWYTARIISTTVFRLRCYDQSGVFVNPSSLFFAVLG